MGKLIRMGTQERRLLRPRRLYWSRFLFLLGMLIIGSTYQHLRRPQSPPSVWTKVSSQQPIKLFSRDLPSDEMTVVGSDPLEASSEVEGEGMAPQDSVIGAEVTPSLTMEDTPSPPRTTKITPKNNNSPITAGTERKRKNVPLTYSRAPNHVISTSGRQRVKSYTPAPRGERKNSSPTHAREKGRMDSPSPADALSATTPAATEKGSEAMATWRILETRSPERTVEESTAASLLGSIPETMEGSTAVRRISKPLSRTNPPAISAALATNRELAERPSTAHSTPVTPEVKAILTTQVHRCVVVEPAVPRSPSPSVTDILFPDVPSSSPSALPPGWPNTHPKAEYPPDLFSVEDRRQGWVVLHIFGMMYVFVALAIVCDEYFVPALGVITDKLQISEDVAGATFMAAGGSAPELFTSLIGVFISHSNVGIGTIVGSAVFNILFVIGTCALFSREILNLTWWPLFRDVSFYILDLSMLILFFLDSLIDWWESLLLLLAYALYVFTMKWNKQIECWVKEQLSRRPVAKVTALGDLGKPSDGTTEENEQQDNKKLKEDVDEAERTGERTGEEGETQPGERETEAEGKKDEEEETEVKRKDEQEGETEKERKKNEQEGETEAEKKDEQEEETEAERKEDEHEGQTEAERKEDEHEGQTEAEGKDEHEGETEAEGKEDEHKRETEAEGKDEHEGETEAEGKEEHKRETEAEGENEHEGETEAEGKEDEHEGETEAEGKEDDHEGEAEAEGSEDEHEAQCEMQVDDSEMKDGEGQPEATAENECEAIQGEKGADGEGGSDGGDSEEEEEDDEEEDEEEEEEEEEEENEEPLSLEWPESRQKQAIYLFLLPIVFPLWLTVPDVRRQGSRKFFVITFLGSIIWIAMFSYLMVWWAHQVGETIGISEEIMGLTILAAGTSIPDLITSVIVARKGLGDMAVSSSVGSNIFDITVGLPVPWLLFSLINALQPVPVSSNGLFCAIVLLFLMLLFVISSIASCKWRMNKILGFTMFLLYFVFLVISVMLEDRIISCPVSV
ncbi:sodium/potassium/calcium exchanger 1 isoform X2 [Meriones unguiculatus]|uniref:sodium/potassium/calcium exchanger 1 isoform X2 n=1 Tax=Meriones unguiculatus TaxID=10047 RepID=UPI00293E8CB2|nr:sodium/potassium/calcium exchanger 1 isoform X2 [Meriones unguiculatus]